VVLVVIVAAVWGQDVAIGLWHDYSGYPIFLISIVLMLTLDRLFNMDYRTLWKKAQHRFLDRASS
jgi:hypothetical protein